MAVNVARPGEFHVHRPMIGLPMIIKKLVATALFAIASTGIAMATAHGEGIMANLTMNGVDGAIPYTTTLAADHSSATVDLASGKFEVTPDAINVIADNGAIVGTIPTTLRMETGQNFSLTPSLGSTARTLTLTPAAGVPSPAAVNTPPEVEGLLHNALLVGVFVGASIGCAVGVLIGIWFFLVGAVIGCAIGAAIGATIGLFFPI
ncbi:hypothetical protein ACIBG0_30940 [Nocardia sp. NPDC050630]|uniref:hypothetical protein n=1 Tax=Nocardia sp. NPDC050630 TaxID=3364321 RepID=UPI0037A86CA5